MDLTLISSTTLMYWFMVGCVSENDLLYLDYLVTCEELNCANYATCVDIDRQPTCQCPKKSECPTKQNAVCGSDGKAYLNDCYMKVSSCEARQMITVKNRGVCGKLSTLVIKTLRRSMQMGVSPFEKMFVPYVLNLKHCCYNCTWPKPI